MDKRPQPSLKEKWHDHWNKRKVSSTQEQANLAGVLFFWGFTATLMLTTLLFAIPHHYRYNENSKFVASFLVLLIFIESAVNWVMCVIIKNSITDKINSEGINSLPEGWKSCLICQKNTPPRAYHCKICQTCVLKRDCHCFLTGVCVGFNNQRNFVVFLFYSLVGSIYGIYLLSHYLGQFYDVWSHEGWIFVPFVAFWQFIFGNFSLEHFLLMGQMYVCVGLSIVSGYFFLFQLAVVITGRTTYEATKCTKRYQGKGRLNNIRNVFGSYWLLQFILPIPTALPGDGAHWNIDDSSKWN